MTVWRARIVCRVCGERRDVTNGKTVTQALEGFAAAYAAAHDGMHLEVSWSEAEEGQEGCPQG